MTSSTTVLVFAKAPIPGQAKTRLIPALGPEGAARFQAALTRRTLTTACTAFPGKVILCCTPDASDPWYRSLAEAFSVELRNQHGQDLGGRMDHALTRALADHERAILIGTDCPVLTPAELRSVDKALADGAETVIVPAEDGGYVLVALSRPFPELFSGIEWGTNRVLVETLRKLETDGRPARVMEPLWDIDEPEDLDRLRRRHPDIQAVLDTLNPKEIDR